jgi:centrosomal CEP192-like protein
MKTHIRLLITLLCAAIATVLIALALFTPAHAASTPPVLAWSVAQYDFGSVPVGQTPSQTFTLSNTGGRSSGTIVVTLAGSATFSITADGCTGRALGPSKSCQVTVQYAPINTNGDTGTLTATGEHTSTGMNLYGNGSPDLVLSPGTRVGTGTNPKVYDYANNFVAGNWSTTFTVTNNGAGTSETLTLAGCCHAQFTLSNDTCSGNALTPGGSCTFDLTFTAPAGCNPGDEFHTPLNVIGTPSFYILFVAHGFCPL